MTLPHFVIFDTSTAAASSSALCHVVVSPVLSAFQTTSLARCPVHNEVWLQPHFRSHWDSSLPVSFKLSPNIYSTCGSPWGAPLSRSCSHPFTYPASLAHNRLLTCIAGSWFRLSTWLALNDGRQATWMEVHTAAQENTKHACSLLQENKNVRSSSLMIKHTVFPVLKVQEKQYVMWFIHANIKHCMKEQHLIMLSNGWNN